MDKDLKRLLKEVEAQGFTVKFSKRGYPMVYKANGDFVAKLAQTPSDRRSWRNGIAALRRGGLVWPR